MINHKYTGDIKSNVKSLLISHNKAETYEHVKAVADMSRKIAVKYGLDENVCELSSYLHDISAIIPPNDMLGYALNNRWYIDEAESKYPFLLHQRISEVIAKDAFGITDKRILSSIGHHTTLKADPSAYDIVVFIADKLAWDQEGEAPFYSQVLNALDNSLEEASLAYMNYMTENKMILHPHRLWGEAFEWLNQKIKNNYIT